MCIITYGYVLKFSGKILIDNCFHLRYARERMKAFINEVCLREGVVNVQNVCAQQVNNLG